MDMVIITPERTREWNARIDNNEAEDYVIFGFNEENYLELSNWLQSVLKFIQAQNAIIEAYENDAMRHNGELEKY